MAVKDPLPSHLLSYLFNPLRGRRPSFRVEGIPPSNRGQDARDTDGVQCTPYLLRKFYTRGIITPAWFSVKDYLICHSRECGNPIYCYVSGSPLLQGRCLARGKPSPSRYTTIGMRLPPSQLMGKGVAASSLDDPLGASRFGDGRELQIPAKHVLRRDGNTQISPFEGIEKGPVPIDTGPVFI